jgi:hypothetical protein
MERARSGTAAEYTGALLSARECTAKHGYEIMMEVPARLIIDRAIIRVISSILPRIIEGLTIAI